MSGDAFQATVERLWERLGLPRPRFAEPDRVRLQVDRLSVHLTDTGLGRMRIEATAGRFSPEGPARSREMRAVLETNLGLLVGNDAGVHVSQTPSGAATLVVYCACTLRGVGLDRLVGKIEDVVRVAEFYAAELKARAEGAPPPRRAEAAAPADEMMIFRP